jgi:hypothetical protein
MDVRVIETLSGVPQAEDVLRVWGDCGLLCRVYPDAWEIGDTVIWALKYTDLMGNGMCGTELEQEGEWMISVCGTYYLDYQGGVVTGAIAEGVSELPYGDFLQFMSSCLATSIPEAQEEIPVEVSIIGMDLVFKVNGPIDGMSYDLYDAAGKQIGLGAVNAQTMNVPLANVSAGVLFLKLSDGIRSRTLKVVRP